MAGEGGGRGIVRHYRAHILVAIALALALVTGFHGALSNALSDLRFRLLTRAASGQVVVVAIDPASIERIGVWPWPRSLHAELLRQLTAAGAREIAFDVDFSTPSEPQADAAFAAALREAGGSVVLPSFMQSHETSSGKVHVNRPLKAIADQSWSAMVNVGIEKDGRVRRYPHGDMVDGEFVPSMAAMLAGRAQPQAVPFLIDFGIDPASIPLLSYAEVVAGDPKALARVKDRRVIVGGTALELGDRFSIPNGAVVPGPVLQAMATESMLQHRDLRPTGTALSLIAVGLLAMLMAVLWRRRSLGMRVALLTIFAGSAELGALILQARQPVVIDTSLLLIAVLAYLAAIALDEIDIRGLLGRIAEHRFQRIAMSLGDGLVCTDARQVITVWNNGAVRMFGRPASEMIGRRFDAACDLRLPGSDTPVVLDAFDVAELQSPGGKVIEFEGRRAGGEAFSVEACLSGWQGADGLQYGAILRDITVRKREAERMRYLAEYDTLTGLPNRHTLRTHLAGAIASAESGQRDVALLLVGLDKFQAINDLLGHATGDQVLHAAAQRLRQEVGHRGFVARLQGDEFAVVIAGADLAPTVATVSSAISAAFETPLLAAQREHHIRVTIGAAIFPRDGRTPDELLGNSHMALSRAKAVTRGHHLLFQRAIRDEVEGRLRLEAEVALAADRGEFELFYQPQVRLGDHRLVGAEALIRWRHPLRGLVSPGDFMPVVNTSPSSDRISTWVIRTACAQARRWEAAGHPLRVGVNLSPSLLQTADLVGIVRRALADTGLSPHLLELEVTEDILLGDADKVLGIFGRLRHLGVRLVFDDFGTGYASLSYLRNFPLDGLKIDRSFVMQLEPGSRDAAIVGATISLGRHLGLSVIAEGIESGATAEALAAMGCEEGQGYHFGKPMPVAEFDGRFFGAADCPDAPALAGHVPAPADPAFA
jgi:diguanylate cyclase (GGDEF)-like protein/PAS domain S-box-containing protein